MTGELMLARGTHRRMYLIVLPILFLLGSSVAVAQIPTGTILGVVKDPSAAAVPGATITIQNTETGFVRTATTGADGAFRVPVLPVGHYVVKTEKEGFKTETQTGLVLDVSQELVINISLQIGSSTQLVEVTGEAPLVNTTSGSLGGLVDEQKMADLPLNGRSYIDLSLLQPGVTQFNPNHIVLAGLNGMWFSSNGAPIRSNDYLLDGAIMVNFAGVAPASAANTTLGLDGIQEYRVITNNFSAEYGMTMGSQMTIVSKGGSNRFSGDAFEFLRNSVLDARNFFDAPPSLIGKRLPNFIRNNFGGAFGGPIRKDKTFFFGVYEGLRERKGITTVSNVIPASAKVDGGLVPQINPAVKPLLALFPDPNLGTSQLTFPYTQPAVENYGQMRVDHNFSSKDTTFVRYTIDDSKIVPPGAYPQIQNTYTSRAQFFTLSENHVFSPSLINTSRFSFSRQHFTGDTFTSGPQVSLVPGLPVGNVSIGGLTAFEPDSNNPLHDTQNIFTWSDDLFYTRGRHSLKFGTLINHYQQYMLSGVFSRGRLSFANTTQFLLGVPTLYWEVAPGSINDRTYHYNTLGFYAGDDIRLSHNLTLNLGFRYEFMTQMNESQGRGYALRNIYIDAQTTPGPLIENPSHRNFGPRLGFAWDVMGDGKTAVRGGFALLYDLANIGITELWGNVANPPLSSTLTLVNPPPPFALPLVFPASIKVAYNGVGYKTGQPHLMQYNLTLDRQLPFAMGLTVGYAGSRGINLMQIFEGDPTIPQGVSANGQCVTRPTGQAVDTFSMTDGSATACYLGNDPLVNPNWATGSRTISGRSNSWYNSFQVALNKNLSRGLQLQSSYTFSKLIDQCQGQIGSDCSSLNPYSRSYSQGLADFDIRQNWRFNAIYQLPSLTSDGVWGKVLNGWSMSGILSLQKGYPFTPIMTSNRSRSQTNAGAGDRPNVVPGRSYDSIILGGPVKYFDPTAFSIPTAGFLGNEGRGYLIGPGLFNMDYSLVKDTRVNFLREGSMLQFRAEFFNLLNRANFGLPSTAVYAGVQATEAPIATAGKITSTVGTARQIQFALKFKF